MPIAIAHLIQRHPLTLAPETSASDAIVTMSQNRASYVLVVDEGQAIGILTERDVVRIVATSRPLQGLTLTEIMTQPVVTQPESELGDLFDILQQFRQRRIRHLPIVDHRNHLTGILTPQALREALEPEHLLQLRQVKQVMTLAVVSAPPTASLLKLAELMNRLRISCVVIVETSSDPPPAASASLLSDLTKAASLVPIGIITERDIVQFRALKLDFAQVQAQAVMSAPLSTAQPEDSLWEVQQQMQRLRVRRLVVVGETGAVKGLITQTDLLRVLDPLEMYRVIEALQQSVQECTIDLQHQASQQQQITQDLAASEARHLNILDTLTELVCRYRTDGTLTYVNRAYCRFFDKPPEALLGQSFLDLLPAVDRQMCQQAIVTLTQTQGQGVYRHWECRSTGEQRWFEWENRAICDSTGAVVEFQASGRDMTEVKREEMIRQQAEAALQTSEARFRAIFEQIQLGMNLVDLTTGRYLQVNQTFCNFLGYSEAELLTKTFWEITHAEDIALCRAQRAPIVEGDAAMYRIEKRFIHKNGQPRWAVLHVSRVRDVEGVLQAGVAIVEDITACRQIEADLQTTEAKLSQTLERVGAVISRFSVFPDGRLRNDYFSPGCEPLYGYTAEELIADPELWLSRVPLDDRATIVTPALQAAKQQPNTTLKFRFRHRDGSLRWISETLNSEWDASAQVWRVSSLQVDCTDRQLAETARHESEERFLQLAENISQVFYLVSTHKPEVYYINPACEMLWGRPIQNATYPRSLIEAIHLEDLPQFLDTLVRRRQGEATVLKYRIVHADGALRWICDRSFPVLNQRGELYRVAGIAEDITAQQAVDRELRQAKETAELANQAKSQFLSHMSHELRTPLNVILGFTQLLHHEPNLIPEHKDYLRLILNSGEHLLALINDVLEMSKIEAGRASLNEASFDLYQMLDRLEAMLRLKAQSKQLTLHFHRSTDVPQFIQTDEGKLRQVLLNLLSNALKFTEQGQVGLRVWGEAGSPMAIAAPTGSIGADRSSESKQRPGDAAIATLTSSIAADSPPALASPLCFTLHFEVKDTGCGIAETELEQLFQSFVQTESGRRSQQGTGLGLSICQQFVRLMHGTIAVSSGLNQGSTFRFTIQALRSQLPAPPRSQSEIVGLGLGQPSRRILVADDQDAARLLTVQLLRQVGFEVQAVADGQAAIDLWQHWQPDLILMDMQMPRLNGYESTQQIRLLEPGTDRASATKIVALTAFAFEEQRLQMLAVGCDDCVSKPFRIQDLLRTIGDHLELSYAYAPDPPPMGLPAQEPLLPELGELPVAWRATLRQSAIQLDGDRCVLLVQSLPPERSRLAAALTERINNFRFDLLIQALQQLEQAELAARSASGRSDTCS